ncbi:CoA-binding protein [Candidatus Bathyarchaeota archaeon]|nr:CoA-binding protein [Candidatus Bathyarchaeota archaeon]
MSEVDAIFEPSGVILIGSSKLREKVGLSSPQLFRSVTYNMKKFFRGEVYVKDIEKGQDFEALPKVPELAVIMLPPEKSIDEAEKCAKMGVKAFIMITGGYKDEQRQKLLRLKERHGVRILGPNTVMGVINTANGLNTTFEMDLMPKRGSIAVISQSGGVGACLLDWACYYKIGISKFAFMGDKIDVDDADLLRYLAKDKETRVICLYMEGVKNGRKFMEEARKIVVEKPILALKGGITQESAYRAKSHTASMAGSDEIFDAAFKKAGIIRVEDPEELLNAAVALSKQPPMFGDNIAIVSNVGGPAILAADAVARINLKLARLSDDTKRKIESLHPGLDATNPIDIIADARADRYKKILELVLADKNVDGVLIINMLKSCFFEPEDAKVIPEITAKYPNKPVVDVATGGEDFVLVYRAIGESNIPVYNLPEKGVKVLKILRTYGKILERLGKAQKN